MLSSFPFLKPPAPRLSRRSPSTVLDVGHRGNGYPSGDTDGLEMREHITHISSSASTRSLASNDSKLLSISEPEPARLLEYPLSQTTKFEDEKQPMPPKNPLPTFRTLSSLNHHGGRNNQSTGWGLRNRYLSAYHVLVTLVFLGNLAAFVHLRIERAFHPDTVLTAVSANLCAAVLVRNEYFLNFGYLMIAKTPSSTPFIIRKHLTDFSHYGGVHIGSAVSAVMWYGVFLYLITAQNAKENHGMNATVLVWANIITCYIFAALIFTMCLAALPAIRRRYHNTFEMTHRFTGWVSILTFWANTIIAYFLTHTRLWKQPSFYLLSLITLLLISPWLRIRRVPMSVQHISPKEAMLTFPYSDMPYMATLRFSKSPLFEWHAFATIPSSNRCFAATVVSRAGDWTNNLLQHPPETLWVRKPTTPNFLCLATFFKSILLLATGGGIGPILSLLCSPQIQQMIQRGARVKIMWCVHDPYAQHWQFVIEAIRNVDPVAVIFDSRNGRPDLVLEVRYGARVEGVEAVFVVSNKKVTDAVVSATKADGVAAYGAVFDS